LPGSRVWSGVPDAAGVLEPRSGLGVTSAIGVAVPSGRGVAEGAEMLTCGWETSSSECASR
jgi:hypothetical protein